MEKINCFYIALAVSADLVIGQSIGNLCASEKKTINIYLNNTIEQII